MTTATKSQKAELINPNTGRRMNIDKLTYDLISKAIYHVLKKEGAVTFTQLQEGVETCLKEQKTKGSEPRRCPTLAALGLVGQACYPSESAHNPHNIAFL